MFTGDRSGEWLYEALHRFGFANQAHSAGPGDGLRLRGCIVTAACRCAPPANRPLPAELENCLSYLVRELELLRRRRVILALGQIAFRAVLEAWRFEGGTLPGGRVPAFRHSGEWELAGGLTLLSSYHPSQQNTLTGRLTREMFHAVFRRARTLLPS
jgi:uracil-DNA glycosylase family 4